MAIVAALIVLLGAAAFAVRRESGRPRVPETAARVRECAAAPDWIAAMRAEHAAIADPRERRRFARGCVRAVLLGSMPADRIGRLMQSTLMLAIAGAAALATVGLLRYPGLRSGWWLAYVAVFVALLVGYGVVGRLIAVSGTREARLLGVAAALPAVGLAAVAGLADDGLAGAVPHLTFVLPAFAAWAATRHGERAEIGIVAAASCAVTAGLLAFLTFVSLTYARNGGSPSPALLAGYRRSGIHDYATWAVGDNLGGAVFLLGVILVVGTAAGTIVANGRGRGRAPIARP